MYKGMDMDESLKGVWQVVVSKVLTGTHYSAECYGTCIAIHNTQIDQGRKENHCKQVAALL